MNYSLFVRLGNKKNIFIALNQVSVPRKLYRYLSKQLLHYGLIQILKFTSLFLKIMFGIFACISTGK